VNHISRVLCAVDFSEPAQAAFEQALVLSRARNAELTVVHAVPKDRPFRWHARERMAMMAALQRTAKDAGVRLKVSVQHGNPAGVILLHARARRPHLVVIATHQRTGLRRFRSGSIAETVTLRAACPVLIVPGPARGSIADVPTSFGRILCAVDFRAASHEALHQAFSLAKKGDGHVTLVHVPKGISAASVSRNAHQSRVPEYQRFLGHDAWRRLQEVIPTDMRRSGRVHARVMAGDPSTAIIRSARDVNADLIVVGVTARGAVGRRIFGATATRVMRTAACPVLAVPEFTRRTRGPSDGEPVAVAA
jgi:nucleotide-binding universal stress UspA family protein